MKKIEFDKEMFIESIKNRLTAEDVSKALKCSVGPVRVAARKFGLSFSGKKMSEKSDDRRFVVWGDYRGNAKSRGYEFSLTYNQFFELIVWPCIYCGDQGSNVADWKAYRVRSSKKKKDFHYTGIDRVDSTKGYTLENSVPCCKICNRAKRSMTLEVFKAWIEKIIKHNSR